MVLNASSFSSHRSSGEHHGLKGATLVPSLLSQVKNAGFGGLWRVEEIKLHKKLSVGGDAGLTRLRYWHRSLFVIQGPRAIIIQIC